MKVKISDGAGLVSVEQDYPLVYRFTESRWRAGSDHIEMARWINDNKDDLSAYMFIVEDEFLADEHLSDPKYLERTHSIGACEAAIEARRRIGNSWFSKEDIESIIKKYQFPTHKYNYKDQDAGERQFKYELEDALFEYQERVEKVRMVADYLNDCSYKLDEDGFAVENEEGDLIVEADPDEIEKNKEKILERLLMPKLLTDFRRVYEMPEPFCHWDSRSFWHQFFFLENHKTKETLWDRGHSGGSGTRESNGRWAHTFALLTKEYGFSIPTWHFIYDEHNRWIFHTKHDTFKTLRYDLTGNYQFDHQKSAELFKGLLTKHNRKLRWGITADEDGDE